MQVEEDDVRLELGKRELHLARVGHSTSFVGGVSQKCLQKEDITWLVINDQDAVGQFRALGREDTTTNL
jgi:hypothetical protein